MLNLAHSWVGFDLRGGRWMPVHDQHFVKNWSKDEQYIYDWNNKSNSLVSNKWHVLKESQEDNFSYILGLMKLMNPPWKIIVFKIRLYSQF